MTAGEGVATGDLLAHVAELGVHRIEVAIPFGVRAVNVFLLEGSPLTLIDCGPNSATGLETIHAALAARGHRLADVERIVVTHHHIDHLGLAGTLQRLTGAELCCLAAAAPAFRTWEATATRDDDDARDLMLRHGVEPQVAAALRAVADVVRAWGGSSVPDRLLADGDRLEIGGGTATVHHRPGHSTSDILLLDAERRLAFCGDHLLADISSNAVLARPLGETAPLRRPQPLIEYRASLRATRDLDFEIGLGGHGRAFTDHRALIDARLAAHDARVREILDVLGAAPVTAHEICHALWGPTAITQVFLTLSEVLGHLDLLTADGLVVEERGERLTHFRRL
jgi:glyoxylase-like metal-dependent hydrolase (beta-lactamase superfamily II)